MTNLDAQYRAAQTRLGAADDAIRRASRDRLAVLMRLSDRERFEHLEDADLAPQDRAELRRSVAVKLTRPRPPLFRLISTNWLRRRLRPRPLIRVGLRTAAIAPPCIWALMAWLHTGQLAAWDHPLSIVWTLPSGETVPRVLRPGAAVVLVHHRGLRSYIRYWLAGQGYATAEVNVGEGQQ